MKNYHEQIIESVAAVMTDSFLEDPGSVAMLDGIRNPEDLMQAHSLLHSAHAFQTRSLNILDNDPRAFLVGYDSLHENKAKERNLQIKIILKTFSCIGLKNLRRMVTNSRRISKVLNLSWHRDYIKGRHYRIKIIAVDKALRGSGAFRRLIAPVLEYAEREKIPVVLETLNPTNVGLYEHFGFTLVKTITHPGIEIKQFCMIRYPEEA
ncbi:MAG: N-acetyltransferase [Bacteroidetes bacterium]|nr:MAG: N-acetyltransferase [Bacteroidota bacterium]